jgi:hypothetical protein
MSQATTARLLGQLLIAHQAAAGGVQCFFETMCHESGLWKQQRQCAKVSEVGCKIVERNGKKSRVSAG